MSISLHQVTVPVFIRGLGNLIAILDKGAASTYDILRHNGVELGKQDFIGKPRAPGAAACGEGTT
jgi:hypothetical protein